MTIDAWMDGAREVVAHPNFPFARMTYALGMFRLYKSANIVRFLVNETARALIGNICILMDLNFDPDDPYSGLTVRKIQKACAQRGVASPGRVFAFVKMLELSGFLESAPAPDKRFRFLRPTAKLLAYRAEIMGAIYSALDHIFPEREYARRGGDRLTDEQVVRVAGKDFFCGLLLLENHPDILMFADRDGGYQFLLKILGAAGVFAPPFHMNGKVGIALQDISRRSGLSRSHLRSILREAEQRGLMRIETTPNYMIHVLPKLVSQYDEHVALLLAYYAHLIDFRLNESCPPLF